MLTKIPTLSNSSTLSVNELFASLLKQMAKQLDQGDYPWLFANLTLYTNMLRCESLTLSLPWLTNDCLPFLSQCYLTLDDRVREFDFRHRLHALVRGLFEPLQKTFANDNHTKIEINKILNPLLTDSLVDSQHGIVNLPRFYEQTQWKFESFFNAHDESKRFDDLRQRHGQRTQSLANQTERNRYRYLSEPVISYWKTLANQYSEIFKTIDKQPLIALGEGLWGAIISDPQKYKDCWQPLLVLQGLLADAMSIANATTISATITPIATPIIPSAFAGVLMLHQLANPIGKNTSLTKIETCLKEALALNVQFETVIAHTEDCALFRFDEAKLRLQTSRQGFVCQNPIAYESLHQVFTVQQKHTKGVMELLNQFVQAAQTALGPDVVDVAFCVLGSTSRQDRRPYSDLEFLVLYTPHQGISREQAEFYVFQCIALVEMQIIALGETHNSKEIHYGGLHSDSGLHIDTTHHVFDKNKGLWGTPQAIMDKFIRTPLVYRYLFVLSSDDAKELEIADEELLVRVKNNRLVLDRLNSHRNIKLAEEESKEIIFRLPPIGTKSQDVDLINRIVSYGHATAGSQHPWVADQTFYALLQPILINEKDSTAQRVFASYQGLVKSFLDSPVNATDQPVLLKKTIGLNPQGLTRRQAIAVACCLDVVKKSADQFKQLKNGDMLDIKQVYYKPLAYFAMNLKLFYDLKTVHPTESFRAVAKHYAWAGDLIERLWCDALAFVSQQQVNLHLVAKHQEEEIKHFTFMSSPMKTIENIATVNTTSTSPLQNLSEQVLASGLDLIATGLILPLAQELAKAIQGSSLFSFQDITYPILRAYLAVREKWFIQWQEVGVPKKVLFEHPLLRSLETTPAFDGWSPYYERQKTEQINALRQFVSPIISYCQIEGLPTQKEEEDKKDKKMYLPEAYAKTWFDNEGNFLGTPNYSNENSQVRRVECEKAVFYFKVKDGNPEALIGREFAVQTLHGLLGGESQLAWGWPLKLTYSRKDVQKICYDVWVSSEVLGESLYTVMVNTPERLKANAIEMESYSQHFLLAYLTCPEDGQPENFKLQRTTQGTSRLIGIDVGQSFVNTIKQEQKSPPVIGVKTMVYCLDQATLPLAESVITRCKLVDKDAWFARWQQELNCLNRFFKSFVENSVDTTSTPTNKDKQNQIVSLPKTTQQCVRQRFQLLQRYLIALAHPPTGWQLIERLDPLVALSYQSLQGKIKTPNDFYRIDPKAYAKDPTTERIHSRTAFKQIQAQTLNPEQLQETFKLQPDYFDQINFNAMRKNGKIDEEQQRFAWALLKATAKKAGESFGQLNLSGCWVINETELIAVLEQMPNLKELNLENCPNINLEIIFNLFSHRHDFSGLFWLNYAILCEKLQKIRFTYKDKPTHLVAILNSEGRRGLVDLIKSHQTQKAKVINILIKALGNSESDVRDAVAAALGSLESTPHLIDVLVKALGDSNGNVRNAAAKALGRLEPTPYLISALVKGLGDSNWHVRRAAATASGNLKTMMPQIIGALFKALGDSESYVRRAATEALGNLKITTPQVIDALIKALDDSDSVVRKVAATALGNLKTATLQVIDALVKVLDDSESYVRRAAAEALGNLKIATPQIIDTLVKILSDSDLDVHRAVIEALGKLKTTTPQVSDTLVKALSDSNWHVRHAAAEALGNLKIATPQVIDVLVKALGDDWGIYRVAVKALVNLERTPYLIDALVKALGNSASDVRRAAAIILGNLGATTPQVIDALIKVLGDSDSDVRRAVAIALRNIKIVESQVIDTLVEVLSNSNSYVRKMAAEVLGNLKTATPQVIDALVKALGDSESCVRRAATEALGKLETTTSQATDALLKILSNSDYSNWEMRRVAATALGNLKTATPQVLDALVKALGDLDLDVRQAAATALGNLKTATPQVIDALVKALGDYSNVCKAATEAVMNLKTAIPQVIDALLKAFYNSNSGVREAVAETLGNLETATPQVIDILVKALNDSSLYVRRAAVTTLENLKTATPQVIDALVKAFGNSDYSDWEMRRAVVTALGNLKTATPQAIDVFLKALEYYDLWVRRMAAEGLNKICTNHYELNLLKTYLLDSNLNSASQNHSKYENTFTKEITQKIFFFVSDKKSFRAIPCVSKNWQRWHQALVGTQSEHQYQKLLGKVPHQEINTEEETSQENTSSERFQFTPKVAPQ